MHEINKISLTNPSERDREIISTFLKEHLIKGDNQKIMEIHGINRVTASNVKGLRQRNPAVLRSFIQLAKENAERFSVEL